MSETLIVIATHKGADLLAESLPKMRGRNVVVVETGVRDADVARVCKENGAPRMCTPYRGYDTGAYLWAYWNIKDADNYLFLQDSVIPREADFVEQFEAKANGASIVGWSSFDIGIWDSFMQCDATEWMYGPRSDWPTYGIFGPIFFARRMALEHMDERGLLPMPPVHKEQQQAMERAWAILAQRAGLRVNYLVEEDMPRGVAMERGEYPALTKTFRVRA